MFAARATDFFANELAHVHRAIVVVKGWHTGRSTPNMGASEQPWRSSASSRKNVLGEVTPRFFPVDAEEFGNAADVTILKAAQPARRRAFPVGNTCSRSTASTASLPPLSMLLIIERVEINKSYGKSDTLQVIRILKNYDLFKDAARSSWLSASIPRKKQSCCMSIHPTGYHRGRRAARRGLSHPGARHYPKYSVLGDGVVHPFAVVGGDPQYLPTPATVSGVTPRCRYSRARTWTPSTAPSTPAKTPLSAPAEASANARGLSIASAG